MLYYVIPINPEEVINSFKNLTSLSDEAKDKLKKLLDNLKFVAPELVEQCIFYDFKSQQGLTSLLNEHGIGNEEAINLYKSVLSKINNVI